MKYRINRIQSLAEKDDVLRLLGKQVGIITSREDLEAYEDCPGHFGPLWGKLSLVSFQFDGTMAALHQGGFVEVFAIVEAYDENMVRFA